MSTELSSTREPRSRFSDKYLPPDREALYELMANPDSLFTHSLFKLMAKPGELTPVRHNEDSGELYFLTADSVAKSPIGSVKIPGPSDIDHSRNRTRDDIKKNGLRIMTLNTAGLGHGTGYPRSIAKLPADTYEDRLVAVGVQRQANLNKLLETIKNYDIITLSDFPDIVDYLEQLKRAGYMVVNTNYMDPGVNRPLSNIETPYSNIQLVNCNRLGVPKSYEISITPHYQSGNIADQNGPADWGAYGGEHRKIKNPVTSSLFIGSTQHLSLTFKDGTTSTTSALYINPASDYLGREATIQTSLTNHKHLAEANRGGGLNFSMMGGDCNCYGPLGDLGERDKNFPYIPAFPWTLARTIIPSFFLTGVNLPNLRELLAHQQLSSKLGHRVANLVGQDTQSTLEKGPLGFLLDPVFVPETSNATVTVLPTSLSDHGIVSTQLLPDEFNSTLLNNQTQELKFQTYVDGLIEKRTRVIAILAAVAFATGFSFYNKTTPNLLVPPPNPTQERQVK